ncbi:hypothetical protein VTK73DRAFT_9538 [Phialemonium thermophilum]|uniref:Aminoglycoside phosphotransferase domain-containing protein n=1 Tax=Phialemonium thermophilum TaxID=223376 RepID=A0ABR3XKX5_9PEZI
MGSFLSRICESEPKTWQLSRPRDRKPPEYLKSNPLFNGGISLGQFPPPFKDPRARDDNAAFPLDGIDLSTVSNDELVRLFSEAPKLFDYGTSTVVRLSKSLVMKGGESVTMAEARNMIFATRTLKLPVPAVHRTFAVDTLEPRCAQPVKCQFIVMDYIPGPTVEDCWNTLEEADRQSVTSQVASMINTMQKVSLPPATPPGPIGGTDGALFHGFWFTDNGAGPFTSLRDLQEWCNHKLDVCIRLHQLPPCAPRFRFQSLVLTHQDIAPRNLILDAAGKVWLIDWDLGGAYPPGFEQAVLHDASSPFRDFADMVFQKLSSRQERVVKQYAMIGYGLSVGANL